MDAFLFFVQLPDFANFHLQNMIQVHSKNRLDDFL